MIKQPLLTPYQSLYFAWLLTRRAAGGSVESLASTLVDSQVDLNPHQADAALFACRNPLSRGVILADEFGLGKTIEAGLVISQRWAERRRRILIIVPANLREINQRNLANANWKISAVCCVVSGSRGRTKSKPSITRSSIRWKFNFNSWSKNARCLSLSVN